MSQAGNSLAEPAPESPVAVDDKPTEEISKESPKPDGPQEEPDKPEADTSKLDAAPPPLPNEKAPDGPPLPAEPVPEGPPLPQEPEPQQQDDDGWDCQWEPNTQAWYFVNRLTGKSQWENPRAASTPAAAPLPPSSERPAAGGYNPAIHGDYDPNAWYAQGATEEADDEPKDPAAQTAALDPYASTARFNRFTGQFQDESMGPGRHSDEAKSKRQMNAFFDVDAAANSHDGRSLKAERSNKKPSKSEVKAFKEKRRARKEEKRRAWLRD